MLRYLLIIILFINNNSFADDTEIQNYVHTLMNKSLNVLNDQTTDLSTKTSQVKSMLASNMDTNWMARFTLGRIIKSLSDKEVTDFINTYNNYVISSYAKTVSLYKGEKVEILSVQNMDDEFSIVKTQVHKNDGNFINVNYLVHKVSGQYKVCDVITEGISLINSQKAEYGSVIASSSISSLISDLKQKTN